MSPAVRRVDAQGQASMFASEEDVLLAEMGHRVANEVTAALAAMRLALASPSGEVRAEMMKSAIGRLEGFGEVVRSLNIRPGATVDMGESLARLCEALCASRVEAGGCLVSLDIAPCRVDGATARRLMLVAAEIVHNALRHAFEGRKGRLGIMLRSNGGWVRLAVDDDGPGIRPDAGTRGTGMGGPIVAELVERGNGVLECESGPEGTRVRVALPLPAGRELGMA